MILLIYIDEQWLTVDDTATLAPDLQMHAYFQMCLSIQDLT